MMNGKLMTLPSNKSISRDIVLYLREQNDIHKYNDFINLWKKHDKANATQFEEMFKIILFNCGIREQEYEGI